MIAAKERNPKAKCGGMRLRVRALIHATNNPSGTFSQTPIQDIPQDDEVLTRYQNCQWVEIAVRFGNNTALCQQPGIEPAVGRQL